jgi:glycosyltransferase involved in cell wall biosynthesis
LTIGLPAWLIGLLQGIPFVHEIQDMWPETLEATGMVSQRWMLKMVSRLAMWLNRRAARIRVISPGFRRNLIEKGVPAEKIRVISNWVDTELFHPAEPNRALSEKHGLAGRFNVMYAGNIGLAQGLETFLKAAELLRDLPEVQFLIVGDGPDGERIRSIAQERRIENVKFLGRFPMEEMPGIQALADVLVVHLRDDALFRITIPHKMFACMACAKPVLMAIDGDGADIIRSAGAGLACPSGNPQAMADAVCKFHAMTPADREKMGENGLRAVQDYYSQDYLTGQIAEMLEEVHAEHNGAKK